MTASTPNPFTAKWSATGSNLCLGLWELTYLGQPLEIDAERKEKDMGTYAIYSFIFPDDDVFAEGLHEDEWIDANLDWLTHLFIANDIPTDEANFRFFYQAVNKQDWRCGSCGGCM
ncbi:MAG: hypothetical protein HY799_11150 [Nitrosomonadales bacterium]|nr:hypothetical protein [Nitrosomonadales bacterium]